MINSMADHLVKMKIERKRFAETIWFSNNLKESEFIDIVAPTLLQESYKVKNLYLEKLNLTDNSVKSIVMVTSSCSLVMLSLENNGITELGLSQLVQVLPSIPSLQTCVLFYYVCCLI
jgi:hypothetical protein